MHPLKQYRSHSLQVQSHQQQVYTHFQVQKYVLKVHNSSKCSYVFLVSLVW